MNQGHPDDRMTALVLSGSRSSLCQGPSEPRMTEGTQVGSQS